MIRKLEKILSSMLVVIGVASLSAIVLLIIVNVLARSLFRSPILWSLEMSGVLVVWFAFILFGVDYYENRHFSIDVITLFLSDRWNRVLNIFIGIVTLTALGFLGYSCLEANRINGSMTLTATATTLTVAFYLPLGVGILSYIIFIILRLLRLMRLADAGNANQEDTK